MSEIGSYFVIATSYSEWRLKESDHEYCSWDGYFDWEALYILETARATSVETLGTHGLFLSETPLCAATAGEQVWARLSSVMDSGPAESVLPVKMADWVPIVASEAYQKGITYTGAHAGGGCQRGPAGDRGAPGVRGEQGFDSRIPGY